MMKLNHINLPVDNVAETSVFFERYFDFKCIDVKGDNQLSILKGEDDFILVLMSKAFNRNMDIAYPEVFHIGFLVDSNEKVDAAYKKLVAGGMPFDKPPGKIRGQYGFYFNAPGGILTEVTAYELTDAI